MSEFILRSKLNVHGLGYQCVSLYLLDILKARSKEIIILDCDKDRQWTGEQVYEASLNIAHQLITECGLKKGDVVCTIAPKSDILYITLLGVLAAGGIYCSIVASLTYREISNTIEEIKASFIVCDSENYGVVSKVASEAHSLKRLLVIDEQSRTLIANCNCMSMESMINTKRSNIQLPIMSKLNETAALIMTSGSTGKPKTVIRTNGNLIARANLMQNKQLAEHSRDEIIWIMGHTNGQSMFLQSIADGVTNAIMRDVNMENLLRNIEKYKITSIFVWPSALYFFAKSENVVKKYNFSSLQDVPFGGAPTPESICNDIVSKYKFRKFRQVYGMTEVGIVSQINFNEENAKWNTVGRLFAGVEVKIIDCNDKPQPANSVGEVCVRGAQVTPGYLNREQENENLFTIDGFLRTGDAGYYDDDGLLYIVARYKEIINIDAVKVSPVELESVLLSHNDILNAAVIGVPHEVFGEVPKAFVILKSGSQLSEQEIHQFVNLRVHDYKRLRGGIRIVNAFPLSNGKVVKSKLK